MPDLPYSNHTNTFHTHKFTTYSFSALTLTLNLSPLTLHRGSTSDTQREIVSDDLEFADAATLGASVGASVAGAGSSMFSDQSSVYRYSHATNSFADKRDVNSHVYGVRERNTTVEQAMRDNAEIFSERGVCMCVCACVCMRVCACVCMCMHVCVSVLLNIL
jgi:hypothetical protein